MDEINYQIPVAGARAARRGGRVQGEVLRDGAGEGGGGAAAAAGQGQGGLGGAQQGRCHSVLSPDSHLRQDISQKCRSLANFKI